MDLHYQQLYKEKVKISEDLRASKIENEKLKKEGVIRDKTMATYEYLLKMPATQSEQHMYKCNQCDKMFIDLKYVEQHYHRRHPTIDFKKDFKPPQKTQTN